MIYKLQILTSYANWEDAHRYYRLPNITREDISNKQYRNNLQLQIKPFYPQRMGWGYTDTFISIKSSCADCMINLINHLPSSSMTTFSCRFNNIHTKPAYIYFFLYFAVLRDAKTKYKPMPLTILADYLEEQYPRPQPKYLNAARHFPDLPGNINIPASTLYTDECHDAHAKSRCALDHLEDSECIEWLQCIDTLTAYPPIKD